jgi:hypothetical protein
MFSASQEWLFLSENSIRKYLFKKDKADEGLNCSYFRSDLPFMPLLFPPPERDMVLQDNLPNPAVITAPSRIAYMIHISEPGTKAIPVA